MPIHSPMAGIVAMTSIHRHAWACGQRVAMTALHV